MKTVHEATQQLLYTCKHRAQQTSSADDNSAYIETLGTAHPLKVLILICFNSNLTRAAKAIFCARSLQVLCHNNEDEHDEIYV